MGFDVLSVDYVEVYGIGMLIGDLIEVMVIGIVFGMGDVIELILVGFVKLNIGYFELVVGIFGLIKFVLVVKYFFVLFNCNF